MNIEPSFVAFWVAFLSSAFFAKPILSLLRSMRSNQTVSEHAPESHLAKQGTPTMGGLIIAFGFIVAGALCPFIRPYLPLFLGFTFIGFLDDYIVPKYVKKRGLGWKQKLGLEILVGVYTAYQTHSLIQGSIVLFLILFMANAYNFSDGLDGLSVSLGGVLFVTLALFGIVQGLGSGTEIATVSVGLVGAMIPFAFLNAPKAKIFMGDVGSLPIGALLGNLIYLVGKSDSHLIIPLFLLSGVMIAELVPVPMQVFSVKVFKKKIFPFTPIHHAFEKAGWGETRVTACFVLTQVLFSAAALSVGWVMINLVGH